MRFPSSRFIRTVLPPIACAIVSLCVAHAGTIRDDRQDAVYTGLASQPQFRASGYLRIFNGSTQAATASGTLIDSQWVLTAAHCVVDEPGIPAGTTWSIEIGSQVVTVPRANVFFPVEYLTSGFDNGFDVALLRLPTPIRGIPLASLSAATDELGKVISTVGYGTTGNGFTGSIQAAGTRRSGQNMVDAFSASIAIPGFNRPPVVLGNTRTLLYDFDSPTRSSSTLGSVIPLHAEYCAAPGDSGGGAFVLAGGGSRVIGVASAVASPNGLALSSYGTTVIFARVSQNLAWIRSAMAGRQPALPTVLTQLNQGTINAAVAVSQQRAAALAAHGFRVVKLRATHEPVTSTSVDLPWIFRDPQAASPLDLPTDD